MYHVMHEELAGSASSNACGRAASRVSAAAPG